MTTSIHEPTPEFERFLEWQLQSAIRRRDRFAAPPPSRYRGYLGVAALVAVAVLAGAGGVVAAGRIQDNQQKQALLEQQQGDLQVAQMQVALAQKALQEVKARVEIGVTGVDAVGPAERDLQSAVQKLEQIKLNIDEVTRSGRPVQDDLASPLVGGRDFVSDRLQLDLKAAASSASVAERRLAQVRGRHEVGLATEIELLDATGEAARAAADMRLVREKLDLRRRFLSGELTVQETTRQRLLIAARVELDAATRALAAASKRHDWLRSRYEIGAAGEMDMLKAQMEVLTKKQELATLQARVRALENAK